MNNNQKMFIIFIFISLVYIISILCCTLYTSVTYINSYDDNVIEISKKYYESQRDNNFIINKLMDKLIKNKTITITPIKKSFPYVFDINNSNTKQYYYNFSGVGGIMDNHLFSSCYRNNSAQITFYERKCDYGYYEYYAENNASMNYFLGWTITGLMNNGYYVGFEYWHYNNTMRTITYNLSGNQKYIFNLSINYDEPHVFGILWLPNEAYFYIDNNLVSYHCGYIPEPSNNIVLGCQAGCTNKYQQIKDFSLTCEIWDAFYWSDA